MLDVVIYMVRLLANIELSVYLILGFFAMSVISLLFLGNSRFFGGLSAHAPTLLTSLGITFTFMGVLRGLLDFDLNNIDEGISELLEGLKVAFISSVLGISMAFVFRLVQLMVQPGEAAGDDVYAIMRNGFKDVANSIGGGGESSLAGRLQNLQHSFDTKLDDLAQSLKEFAQDMVDKSTEALLQALADVIHEFNLKITEQFGENLARFNDGIGEFLAWQDANRKELSGLTETFASVRASLETSAEKIGEIASSTSKLPEQMEALKRLQEIFREEMEQLHGSLGTLAEMRVKAQEAIPTLQSGMNEVMSKLQETNTTASTTVQTLVDEVRTLQSATAQSMESAQGLIASLGEGLQVTIAEAQQSLKHATEESIAGISTAIGQLDNSMQDEVQRCVEVMGNNVTRITEEFVNQYERLAKDTHATNAVKEALSSDLLKQVATEAKKVTEETLKAASSAAKQ